MISYNISENIKKTRGQCAKFRRRDLRLGKPLRYHAILCVGLVYLLPPSLWNIWVALAVFMGTQVIHCYDINYI